MAARRKTPAHNLPVQLTSFVGREREKAEIRRLLSATRLVTLTGSGGAGKTRLALEAAREMMDRSPDGVWIAELAPLSDPALVPKVVATSLGLRDESERPALDSLTAHLHEKSALLIFDNCEHLIGACAHLVELLLRACPHLRILATSREPLGIGGETTLRVPSLSLPDSEEPLAPERLSDYEAPLLFAQRAASVSPHFAITHSSAPAVAEVCRRLDGIPLAIELAAARVKGLTVRQIAARLDDRFRLLVGGNRTALPRQQTLRATMDWSYQLLSEQERILLRRLSVFAGGFSLEAAEHVGAGGAIAPSRILTMLLQLVDKSLIVADDRGDDARYRMLETVRQYGRDRLHEADETPDVQRRHRDWYLTLAESAEANVRGPEQARWLGRMALDHDNFRVALEWSRADQDGAEAALRLATALWWFCFVHGHWSEARSSLEAALARADEAPQRVVPKALHAATFFALRQGDLDRASELGERGIALCRELGDRENRIWLLTWLGLVALRRGRYDDAARILEHGIALSHELRDDWFLSLVTAQMGILARGAGAFERAVALHAKCLSLAASTGDPLLIAYQLRNLGVDSFANGNYDRAADYYAQALRLCRDLGDRWVSEGCIEGLAAVASVRDDHRRATRLFGAGEAIRAVTGDARSLVGDNSYDHRLAVTRSALGETDFGAEWAIGQAMTFDEAIAHALNSMEASGAAEAAVVERVDSARRPAAADAGPLTPREREVAALVAAGVSNRGIATRLFITERTAQTHVQHILDKLGFTSRAQIATWSAQRGLLPPIS